jgi:hypothetical protein
VIDDNPVGHVDSDSEEPDEDTEESTDYELEPNEKEQEIVNIARDYSKNKVAKVPVEEDYDRSDRSDNLSVYSRLVIAHAGSGKDDETSSMKTTKTTALSQYPVMMNDNNISALQEQDREEISKIEKHAVREFYEHSYYMAIHNKVNYYLEDSASINANGFNDYVYQILVQKN